jgi:predicted nucleic-acid-binding Zn-ribbon protein
MDQRKCPKCQDNMEEGFTLDHTHGANLQASWVEGQPRKSFWTGVKLSGTTQMPITTYRCDRCGYLESYATDVTSPDA